MSLIINALKKAEDGGDDSYKPKPIKEEKGSVRKSGKYSLKSDIFFIAVLASVIGVCVSFFMLKFVDMKKGKPVKKEVAVVAPAPEKKEVTFSVNISDVTKKASGYVDTIAVAVTGEPAKVKEISLPVAKKEVAPAVTKEVKKEPVKVSAPASLPKEKPVYYKSGDYTLNGIMYDDRKPMALINNRMVVEGKVMGALRVLRITEEEVFVEINGKKYILMMD